MPLLAEGAAQARLTAIMASDNLIWPKGALRPGKLMKNNDLVPDEAPADAAAKAEADTALAIRAANEDSPTGGALYRMIARRPSKRIIGVAALASIFCIGAEAAYLIGLYGIDGLQALAPLEQGLIAAVVLAPLTLIWMLAWTVWRGAEMRLMSEALARTAIRLSDPEDFATGQITTISEAVRRELGEMRAGLDAALKQAAELKELVEREVEEIDRGTGRAEFRARTMEELLHRHKDGLEEISKTLGAESDTISRAIREQVDAVRGLAGKAEGDLEAASKRLSEQAEALSRTSEAARAGADQTATMLDRQSSRLEVVANDALSKADEIGQRYERQRETIAEAAGRLEQEHQRLQAVFEAHRDGMTAADKALAHHTAEISRAVSGLSAGLDVTFEAAAARAAALRESIADQIRLGASEAADASTSVSRSAGAATRAIGATVDELKAATGALANDVSRAATEAIETTTGKLTAATNAMNHEVTRVTTTLAEEIGQRTEEMRKLVEAATADGETASERFNAAMIRLGGTAREAGRALHEATDELASRIDELPGEAAVSAEALKDVLEEQIGALAAIAEIVVRHARTLDRSAPAPLPRESAFPQRMAPQPELPRVADRQRRWGMSELLAAAERKSGGAQHDLAHGSDQDFQRASLHVIETLQALAIDLDRALEQSPPPELWQRYQAGERNVFTRRLYNLAGRELYDRIAQKYRKEAEFRSHVDRFVASFEELLGAASTRDRDNILVETYLTSDTGKVYLMLGQAIGKLV
ncbi:hypothetical protein Plav_2516 [Parvibaculum lavamentivorans DS-1]|uniref:Uncharacterized protein n=2 Tax=Parvibaculum lavamentivorans TaxID=256618 RepID=A7HW42_PARL1|nr:hypothetical protein Plav_2516 [Parvibaculum lavamentivorans DS-1]